jgi:EAL domain-containing protein (putative c-di-GMP-specific phosphodiesterase class I)
MYHVKTLSKPDCRLREASLAPRSPALLGSEVDLQRALEHREFIIHYQPILSLASGNLTGIEALLRWKHPHRGLLAPREFILLAEATGLIVPIGEWLLRTVCAQAKAWQAMVTLPLRVAVNVSACQLQHPDMLRQVEAVLEETTLTPSLLDLELSEHIAIRDLDLISPALEGLSRLGIRISMDDFGIGYSSLNRLKRLPISSLKIDQSFIRDMDTDTDNAALTAAIISMGHCLRLSVVAEGVERQEQLAFLYSQGCDEIQGYLLSHPLPAEELTEELRCSSFNKFCSAANFIPLP